MEDAQQGQGGAAPVEFATPMTREQRLAFLEDLFAMMAILVLASARKVKGIDPEVLTQVEDGVSVVVSQQVYRGAEEQY